MPRGPRAEHARADDRDVDVLNLGLWWLALFRTALLAFGRGGARRDGQRGETGEQRATGRSEEHTSELQSLMRISYAVFCLKNKKRKTRDNKCTINITPT